MAVHNPIALSGPAGDLEAELALPRGDPRLCAVISHPHPLYGGNMQNRVVLETERALLAAGAATLRFNFRGVGHSSGSHDSGNGERFDLLASASELRRRNPGLPLCLAGYSFGAVVTATLAGTQQAADLEIHAHLLLAPPISHYDAASWQLESAPTAVIFGENDDLTPEKVLRGAASNWGKAVVIEAIPGVGHDLGTSTDVAPLRAALSASISRTCLERR